VGEVDSQGKKQVVDLGKRRAQGQVILQGEQTKYSFELRLALGEGYRRCHSAILRRTVPNTSSGRPWSPRRR
jgi:hypothetical protein